MGFKFRCFGKAILGFFCVVVLGAVVMGLWNWIVPGLFDGAHSIGYAKALGLLILSRLLFGGFRGRGGWGQHRHWRQWQQWDQMTPEERESFKASRFAGCGRRRRAADTSANNI